MQRRSFVTCSGAILGRIARNDLEVAAPSAAAMDDDGDTFTVMGMRFAWMRFAAVCAQRQRSRL